MDPELRKKVLHLLESKYRTEFLADLMKGILVMQRGSYAVGSEPDIGRARCINECAIVIASQLRETIMGRKPGESDGYPDTAFVESLESNAVGFGNCLNDVMASVRKSVDLTTMIFVRKEQ